MKLYLFKHPKNEQQQQLFFKDQDSFCKFLVQNDLDHLLDDWMSYLVSVVDTGFVQRRLISVLLQQLPEAELLVSNYANHEEMIDFRLKAKIEGEYYIIHIVFAVDLPYADKDFKFCTCIVYKLKDTSFLDKLLSKLTSRPTELQYVKGNRFTYKQLNSIGSWIKRSVQQSKTSNTPADK